VQSSDEISDDHTSTVPESSVSSEEPGAGGASAGGEVSGSAVPEAASADATRGWEPTTEARAPTATADVADGDGEVRRIAPVVPAPAGAESADAAIKLRERVAYVPEPAGHPRDNAQRSMPSASARSDPEQARISAPEPARSGSEQARISAPEPARRMMPSPPHMPVPSQYEPRRRVQIDRAERVELARTLPDIRNTPGRPRAVSVVGPRLDAGPAPSEVNPDGMRNSQVDVSPSAAAKATREASNVAVESMGPLGSQSRRTEQSRNVRPGPSIPGVPGGHEGIAAPDPRRTSAGYEPQPSHHSDPAVFERLMREHAAARGTPSYTRPYWNQQDTLLIPRDAFDMPKLPVRGWPWALSIGLATCLGFVSFLLLRDSEREIDVNPFQSSVVASAGVTVISTEPGGAELLQSGAVIGNTPISVSRPRHGDGLYIIRMYGFAPELVRVTSESAATIRVTLTPVAAFGSVSAAK